MNDNITIYAVLNKYKKFNQTALNVMSTYLTFYRAAWQQRNVDNHSHMLLSYYYNFNAQALIR